MTWKLDNVVLPADTVWTDEITETPILQEISYGLDGAILVEETLKSSGRPITLDLGGVARSTVLALQSLAAAASTAHTLTLHDGRQWQVVFQRPTPIDTTPFTDYATSDLDGSELYTTTLHLIRVDGWS